MFKQLLSTISFVVISIFSFAQNIDSLKLADNEIPAGYSKSEELLCVTPHASSFYNMTNSYESFLGKVVKKSFQSFGKKGDQGSILYFEYENDFKGSGFLDGLLWGQDLKPSKSEPDDYYAYGKFLVIWSFNLKSEIKKISKTKVIATLALKN